MKWNPHLCFDGQCEAAFKLYEKCLGGRILTMLTYGDSPMGGDTPAAFKNKILHATFTRGNLVLTGADVLPEQYQRPQGFSVMLHVSEPAEADRVFETLAEGGKVTFPIQATFWTKRFGMVTDAYGTPWIVQTSESG
jgi:PhnB protein